MKKTIMAIGVTVCLALGGVAAFSDNVSANACASCEASYNNARANCGWNGQSLAEFYCTQDDHVCDSWYTCE
jgi:hypothetical protein